MAITLMTGRRSLRSGFSSRQVPPEVVDDLIRCADAAPSSKNGKPWALHAVTDPTSLLAIADAVEAAGFLENYVPIDPSTGQARPEYHSTVTESADVLRLVPLAVFVENRA